jgi:hypothetical protein
VSSSGRRMKRGSITPMLPMRWAVGALPRCVGVTLAASKRETASALAVRADAQTRIVGKDLLHLVPWLMLVACNLCVILLPALEEQLAASCYEAEVARL